MRTTLSLIFLVLTSACATTKPEDTSPVAATKKPDIAPPTEMTFSVRVGEVIRNHPPLPAQSNICITWQHSDGTKGEVLGFRGWDFDGKGTFGMVDVLTSDGQIDQTMYDFDGDGKPDP